MSPEHQKQVLNILGGRHAQMPEWLDQALHGHTISKHRWQIRTSDGLIVWNEVWCDYAGVIQNKNAEADAIAAHGFRSAFLPTRFSVRAVGKRRPLLVTPYDSNVDLAHVAQLLQDSDYVGPPAED